MVLSDGKELCKICGKKASIVLCDGCEVPLCDNCRKFELWGYGCGHVDGKAYCHVCYDDINVNIYGGKRP